MRVGTCCVYFFTIAIFVFIWRVLAHDAFYWSQMTSYGRVVGATTKHLPPLIGAMSTYFGTIANHTSDYYTWHPRTRSSAFFAQPAS